ncbi:MAG: ABC transporter substrate-binding protein [Clostridia bacterium]|nr:ABC transporter substrate-binding protein [Clostridia bacterium]
MKKWLLLTALTVALLFAVAACADPDAEQNDVKPVVMALKGPTGVAMAQMIDDNETSGAYQFSVVGAPEEIVAAIGSGTADIAAMPTNLAAKLYAKTKGDVQMVAVIAFGSLYLLEAGDEVNSRGDLEGKTIYAAGQGANPQYILEYLLRAAGLTPGENVEIAYKSEHAEVAALLASGEIDLAMLPEPNASAVMAKNDAVRVALDLDEVWNEETGSNLTLSCVVARRGFIEAHPKAMDSFLSGLTTSVAYAKDDSAGAAALCAKHGIIGNAAIAETAIPHMGLTIVLGQNIEPTVSDYFNMLFNADPSSVGGALPDADFYYLK